MPTVDTSIDRTSINSLPTRESPMSRAVDNSGAVEGQVLGHAAHLQGAAKRMDAFGTEQLSSITPTVVNTGLQAHAGFALANMEGEINQEIDAYVASQKNPKLYQEAMDMAGRLDLANQSIFSKTGGDSEALDVGLSAYAGEVKKAKDAADQGLMKPSELQSRILAITRKHISANPGLSDQLIQHSEKVLHLSGVKGLRDAEDKTQELMQKRYDSQIKTLIQSLKDNGIPHDIFQMYEPHYAMERQRELNDKLGSMEEFNNISQNNKLHEAKTVEKNREWWASTDAQRYLKGARNSFHAGLTNIIQMHQDNLPQMVTAINTSVKRWIDEAQDELPQWAAISPEGQFELSRLKSFITETAAAVVASKDGSQALEIANNKLKLEQVQGEYDITMRMGNKHIIDYLNKNPVMAEMIMRNDKLQDTFIAAYTPLIEGTDPNGMTVSMAKNYNLFADTNGLMGAGRAFAQAGQIPAFNNTIKTFEKIMKKGNNADETKQYYDDFIKAFNNEQILEDIRKHGSKADVSSLLGMTDKWMEYIGRDIDHTMNSSLGFFEKAKNVLGIGEETKHKVQVLDMPGGGVQYRVPGNFELEQKMNELYADRFNQLTHIMATLTGQSKQSFYNEIKSRYGEVWGFPPEEGKGKPNASNPGNIKEVGGNGFQTFSSPQEGIKAVAKQIGLYISGESQHVNGPTPRPLDFLKLYNNGKEKGSATDKQYADNVAKFSGLDLSLPIDRNDPQQMTDLIYGILKAENTKNNFTRQQIMGIIGG